MNLRQYIFASLANEIVDLDCGIIPSCEDYWVFEAYHLKYGAGLVVFFIIDLKDDEAWDARTFSHLKPCYDGKREFDDHVENEHYWMEPVFFKTTDIKQVNQQIKQINNNRKLIDNCYSALSGPILVADKLAA